MAKKKQRVYTLADLSAIAEQLGGRIRLDLIPVEMIAPADKPSDPSKPQPRKRGASR